jgi:hypothetical protein
MDIPETNPELGKAILEIVENQIRSDDPPATRQTIKRLISEGRERKGSTPLRSSAPSASLR